MMCNKPKTINGQEVACRECNDCCAAYRNTWVARCMAEKATTPHTLAFTLTYGNDGDDLVPLGAKVFRYSDVAKFIKRVRYNLDVSVNGPTRGRGHVPKNEREPTWVRYIIVGEKGSRFGRCHYHGVLFTSHPVQSLGTFDRMTPQGRQEGFAFKRRLNWSIWGHGFVEFQEATKKGIAYTVKYILKSRMNAKKSEGTAREGQTEWLANSRLWVSKKPPIGFEYLQNLLVESVRTGVSPSSLRIRVPGAGDWYLTGKLAEIVADYLHRSNAARPLAGFQTLVKSVSDEIEDQETGELKNRKIWEILQNGIEEDDDDQEDDDQEEFARFKEALEQRQQAGQRLARRKKCYRVQPCARCAVFLTDDEKANADQAEALFKEDYEEDKRRAGGKGFISFNQWYERKGQPAVGCYWADVDPEEQYRFGERLAALRKLGAKVQTSSTE